MEAIAQRIAALQKLRERPGTAEEAAVAAAMVQRMLLKHNLTLADVEAHDGAREGVQMRLLRATDSIWRSKLLGVVAEAHLCKAIRTHGENGTPRDYVLLGHAHNLGVVESVYGWLIGLIPEVTEREILLHWMSATAIGRPTWEHSFRLGMIDGIHQAYLAERANLKAESALVPIDEAVQAALEASFPDAQEHRFGGQADLSAYGLGVQHGRAVNVSPQLEERKPWSLPGPRRAANPPTE